MEIKKPVRIRVYLKSGSLLAFTAVSGEHNDEVLEYETDKGEIIGVNLDSVEALVERPVTTH